MVRMLANIHVAQLYPRTNAVRSQLIDFKGTSPCAYQSLWVEWLLIIKIRYERAWLTSEPEHMARMMVNIADANAIICSAYRGLRSCLISSLL